MLCMTVNKNLKSYRNNGIQLFLFIFIIRLEWAKKWYTNKKQREKTQSSQPVIINYLSVFKSIFINRKFGKINPIFKLISKHIKYLTQDFVLLFKTKKEFNLEIIYKNIALVFSILLKQKKEEKSPF